jgi:EAL domain-containing protein (putative c-di-GMP-specific phosphodiesterase class I)
LRSLGVDLTPGYLIGAPVPADDLLITDVE